LLRERERDLAKGYEVGLTHPKQSVYILSNQVHLVKHLSILTEPILRVQAWAWASNIGAPWLEQVVDIKAGGTKGVSFNK